MTCIFFSYCPFMCALMCARKLDKVCVEQRGFLDKNDISIEKMSRTQGTYL